MENRPTPAQLSEQAGAAEADAVIDAMRRASTQAARLAIFHEGLKGLVEAGGSSPALAGFSVVMVAYIDKALGL